MKKPEINIEKLGHIVDIEKGKKVDKIYKSYYQNRKRFIQIEDLRDNDNLKYTDDKNGVEVEQKDVIIAWDGANAGTIGYGLNGVIGSTLAVMRITNDGILTDFLGRFLQSISKYVRAKCTGATIPHVNWRVLENISIPLLPKLEQKAIAAVLDKANRLRQLRKSAIEKLDQLTLSVFLDMFGQNACDFQSWKFVSIQDLAMPTKNSMRTGPFGSDLLHSEFTDEGILVMGIDNAVNNRFEWGKKRCITSKKYRKLSRYTLYPGDVIITIMGTVGRSAVIPEYIPLSINSKHLAAITLNKEIANPYFISFSIHSNPYILPQIKSSSRGAIMGGLNLSIIKCLKLKLPPIELQNHFAKILEKVENIRQKMQKSLEEMDNLFHSLMQRAFKGELSFNDELLDSLIQEKEDILLMKEALSVK